MAHPTEPLRPAQKEVKFSNHIATKVNKANSILSLIVRTFDFIEQDSFILMYKAQVRPYIEYSNNIWYPQLRRDIETWSLERVQKRVTRLIPRLKDLTYIDRLKTLKLPTLAHRRRRGDMIQTFKIIHRIEDIPSERFFTIVSNSTTHGNHQWMECSTIISCECQGFEWFQI